MRVAPSAETDPSAVSIKAEGCDLPAEPIALRYLPEGQRLPPSLVLGRANLEATMRGSHLAPTIDVSFRLPEAPASGTVQLTREATKLAVTSPYADATGTLFIQPPSLEAVRAAVTQQQATALAKLQPTGADAEVNFKGLDVVPLVSDEASMRQVAQQSGQPLRLRLNGGAKVSGKVVQQQQRPQQQQQAPQQQQPAAAASRSSEGAPAEDADWVFDGSLDLEGIRVNQLKLFQKLSASLQVSDSAVHVHGRKQRANETLDLDLAVPLLPPGPAATPSPATAPLPATGDAVEVLPGGRQEEAAAAALAGSAAAEPAAGGGHLELRCGQLLVEGGVDAAGSQLDFKVGPRPCLPETAFL